MAILKRHIPESITEFNNANAGSIFQVDLPRENFYRRIFLWFLVGTEAADDATVLPLSACMQRVNVLADNQVIKSYSGQELASINCIDYGGSLMSMAHDVSDPTAADDLGLAIDFGLAPTDYRHMIASAELSSFVLQIHWAPVGWVDTHATPTIDVDLKVHTDEVVADDISPDQLGIVQEREVTKLMDATQYVWSILKLPLGNIYRRFIAWAYQSDVYKLHQPDGYFDLFEVVHNGNVMLQSGYTTAHVLEDHLDQRSEEIHREGETVGTDFAYYEDPLVIQFDKDVANLDEVIDTARSSSLEFKVRSTGTPDGTNDYVNVVTQEIIP